MRSPNSCPGAPIGVPEVLFAKIEDSQLAKWSERFGDAAFDRRPAGHGNVMI